MKVTVDFGMFLDAFSDYGRGDQFSYEGLKAIYEYLEEIDECSSQEMELDVIGICCDFSEETIQDIAQNYGIEGDRDEILEYMQDYTTVLKIDDETVVYTPW